MRVFLKRIGYGIGGLLGLVILLIGGVYVVGGARAHRAMTVTPTLDQVSSDSAVLARGEHLVNTLGCRDCHGADLSGQIFADAPPFRATASNLTGGQGGIGNDYSVADWDRAIRHGLHPSGRGLQIMPSSGYHYLTDADAAAVIAYLQSLPAVDNALPPTEIRWLGRVLVGAGQLDAHREVNLATDDRRPAVEPGPTVAYGEYLADLTCRTCHGADLQGGPHPDPGGPPAPDLKASAAWPYEVFVRAMRTGTRPDGTVMDPKWMPWSAFQHHTDMELMALHTYLRTLSVPTASAQ
jgi:mono/diheme cytochrome c family protein